MTARQLPFAPAAGFVQAVAGEAYPTFPSAVSPIKRARWAMAAPVVHRRKGTAPVRLASDKHVLMLLAIYADDAGKAWPALATLAADGNLDRSTVKRGIVRLVESGWLTLDKRVRATSHYWPKSPADQHCRGCWRVLPRGRVVPMLRVRGSSLATSQFHAAGARIKSCNFSRGAWCPLRGAWCPPKYY